MMKGRIARWAAVTALWASTSVFFIAGDGDVVNGNIETLDGQEEMLSGGESSDTVIDEIEDDNFNPMGLQDWSDEKSFMRALQGGRLVLVIMLAPWCNRGANEITDAAVEAANWLEEIFQFSSSYGSDNNTSVKNGSSKGDRYNFPGYHNSSSPLFSYGINSNKEGSTDDDERPKPLPKPIIGTLDPSSVSDGLLESLGPVSAYPALKFVLTFPSEGGKHSNGDDENDNDESEILMWDYIGPRETGKDLYDSILMYWYRFVVSCSIDKYLPFYEDEIGMDADGKRFTISYKDAYRNNHGVFSQDDGEARPPVFTFSEDSHMISFLSRHGDRLLRPAQARRHQFGEKTLESEIYDLYMGKSSENDFSGVFQEYERLDDQELLQEEQAGASGEASSNEGEYTQEIDPYIIFVQCRMAIPPNGDESAYNNESEAEKAVHAENILRAKIQFDEIAEEMSHRRDVAFFALEVSTNNDQDAAESHGLGCGGHDFQGWWQRADGGLDGAVAVLRVRRFVSYHTKTSPLDHRSSFDTLWMQQQQRVIRNIRTDWDSIGLARHTLPALFLPSKSPAEEEVDGDILYGAYIKEQALRANDHVQSSLVAFTVIHATPTVLWFDRHRVAQLAFPSYRPIHAILFVDMALSHQHFQSSTSNSRPGEPPWPASLNRSSETAQLLMDQKRAISLFYGAALRHRAERPTDDVVFVIVPSSDVRILTTFGIDIWTPLDDAVFNNQGDEVGNESGNNDLDQDENAGIGYCTSPDGGKSQHILPVMMITDRSGRAGKQSKRYYMCSDDLFTASPISPENGGAMSTFVDGFFNNSLGKPFFRSEKNNSSRNNAANSTTVKTNESGVHILTGNTFESMVMNRSKSHTMLLLQTTTCGHCKRFSIFWNEFSRLVRAMNWSDVINVMKIDVSKNDVPHDKIDAWDLPAVYYFPVGDKENPIEMEYGRGLNVENSPQYIYDEGLSWVTSGYDLVEWMFAQGKLDVERLLELDEQANPKKEADIIDLD